MQSTSPYGSRRATLLRGEGDVYLYVEDVTGEASETTSAVWVANERPAPTGSYDPTRSGGAPPRMAPAGTRHPDGCPPLRQVELVWFEEGDAVALVDDDGVVAVVPGWGGREGFYGYSRYANGQTPIAWELSGEADQLLNQKVTDSREFWSWRRSGAWSHIRTTGQAHLEEVIGEQEAAWPLGPSKFPEMIASRHRFGDHEIWVTATTGLSAQRMAGVEEYIDNPDSAARIELVIARSEPDSVGAELLNALAQVPFGRCTWLGEGHTVGGTVGSYPAFGPDKASLLLTANPPFQTELPPPDLRGLTRRESPVTYLWVLVIDEETFGMARSHDARYAVAHMASKGLSFVH
jgi:hypothetical protein